MDAEHVKREGNDCEVTTSGRYMQDLSPDQVALHIEAEENDKEKENIVQDQEMDSDLPSPSEDLMTCPNIPSCDSPAPGPAGDAIINRRKMNDRLIHDMSKRRSVSASSKEEVAALERITPRVNCMEKIVICIDLSSEMDNPPFKLGDGSKYSPLYMVKRVVEIFIYSKHRIDKQHEFALVVLHESVTWLRNFTSDPKEICNVLEDLNETKQCESCDLASLFTTIDEKVDMPIVAHPEVIPPPFILRVILIYGRSNTIPQLSNDQEVLKKLQKSPYFFFDVFYVHEQPSNDNKCQEIFECLCDLDEKYTSYVFEVTRNTTKLHNCMAKLLAHPLQRPFQKDTFYKLQVVEDE